MNFFPDKVKSNMSRSVFWLLPQESVRLAYLTMENESIRHIPVLHEGIVVGIISKQDILKYSIVDSNDDLAIPELSVSKIMTQSPLTCSESTTIAEAASMMIKRKIDCLPVTNNNKQLKGIITTADLLELLCDDDQQVRGRIIPLNFQLHCVGSM
jgi:acetoin utilization protein AcuB